jgi:hypothetical protein
VHDFPADRSGRVSIVRLPLPPLPLFPPISPIILFCVGVDVVSITSVGGTTNVPPHAASLFSSGGFSNYFATPSYQAADVSAYIASIGTLYEGLYNKTGRGFPDVSAASHNIEIVWRASILSSYLLSARRLIWYLDDRGRRAFHLFWRYAG